MRFVNKMMYKNLFKRVWNILVAPTKTWKEIALEAEDDKKYLNNYFYPLIGLAAFTAFLNPFIMKYEELGFSSTMSVAIQSFIVSFISSFFGFFVSTRALNYCSVRWLGMTSDIHKIERLIAYASTPVLVISILTRLLSDFFFMKIFFFYVIVLVWEGTVPLYSMEESKRSKFSVLAFILIIAIPLVIEKLFIIFLPGLK